ncbi:MAG TPA: glycosyltransferase family 4 protein [Sporichthyaceae bacterium]|nr:glycosyltransferase family 4 protein [Sporichthyaceae bacterium]
MREPRPLLVVGPSTGGIGRHVRSIVAGCVDAGLAVAVVGPADGDELFGFTALGATFTPVQLSDRIATRAQWTAARTVAAARDRHRASVLHAHGMQAGAIAALGNRTSGPRAPLVVSWHNAPLSTGARRAAWFARAVPVARSADLVLGASADLVALARRSGARDARPGLVAAPPFSVTLPDRTDARAAMGVLDRPFVLTVGRLAPQKDYPTLLTAAASWRERRPVPLLGIVGSGPLESALRRLITAEDLPVALLGGREDIATPLAAADVAVISSVWEARSLFAQEALRAGVPLVATEVGGIPETVGDAALLVPPGNPGALAAAVNRVLTQPELGARLAVAGRARAATWPDEAAIQAELIALYRALSV